MSRVSRTIAAVAGALVCAGMLGGCFLQVDDSSATPARSVSPQERAIHRLFGWYRVNWDPPASTVDLAQSSELVVSGIVRVVRSGRVEGFDSNSQGTPRTLVLAIVSPKIEYGRLPKRSNGIVYVEIPPPHLVDGTSIEEAIPIGAPVVLYLTAAGNGSGLTRISNWNAGRPPGQPLYQPVSPAGLAIAIGDGVRWAWVLDSHPSVVATPAQLLPGGSIILRPDSIRAGAGFEGSAGLGAGPVVANAG